MEAYKKFVEQNIKISWQDRKQRAFLHKSHFKVWVVLFLLQGKAGDMGIYDNSDAAGLPLFTFVDENIFKKETFLGKCTMLEKYFWGVVHRTVLEHKPQNHQHLV